MLKLINLPSHYDERAYSGLEVGSCACRKNRRGFARPSFLIIRPPFIRTECAVLRYVQSKQFSKAASFARAAEKYIHCTSS